MGFPPVFTTECVHHLRIVRVSTKSFEAETSRLQIVPQMLIKFQSHLRINIRFLLTYVYKLHVPNQFMISRALKWTTKLKLA